MAEPTTTTALTLATAGVGVATLFPGVDGNALIGAFAGATLFVVSASELTLVMRLLYLVISITMGYLGAPELINHIPIEQTGVSAFICGLLCITVTLPLIKKLENVDLLTLIKGRFK